MTAHEQPFDTGRPRPIVTALDAVRAAIDYESFDAAVFSLRAVAADLGFGDVRALPGSVAWIDRLRTQGKRIAVATGAERIEAALQLAQIDERVDVVASDPDPERRVARALDELGVAAERVAAVGVEAFELESARAAGIERLIGVARGRSTAEELRRAGAITVLADLQELLGATGG
jgi:phosphoglycolate phosphatase-like HAD superfamily hydrolase